MAKLETKAQFTGDEFEDEAKRFMEMCAVLCAKDFCDEEEPTAQPMAALGGQASRAIKNLATQIHRCCSDEKWSSYQKRIACEQLVRLAVASTQSIFDLVAEFPEPFREIAEELPEFPCLFPAHGEDLPSLKTMMWDELNLGKHFALKLRASPGRKTFSKKTFANQLLIDLIGSVRVLAREEDKRDPDEKHGSIFRDLAYRVPLTPQNAKKWLEVLWEVLLTEIPNPETHPRLRQLVERPSLRTKRMRFDGTVGAKTQGHNMRAAIKARLGEYLKRMLNESAVHK